MASWLFIVAASFLFLWVVDTLTSAELTLLGISAATGLAAAFINQISPPCETSDLTVEEQELRSGIYLGFRWPRRKDRDVTRKRPQSDSGIAIT
jgi:hypothetical protein